MLVSRKPSPGGYSSPAAISFDEIVLISSMGTPVPNDQLTNRYMSSTLDPYSVDRCFDGATFDDGCHTDPGEFTPTLSFDFPCPAGDAVAAVTHVIVYNWDSEKDNIRELQVTLVQPDGSNRATFAFSDFDNGQGSWQYDIPTSSFSGGGGGGGTPNCQAGEFIDQGACGAYACGSGAAHAPGLICSALGLMPFAAIHTNCSKSTQTTLNQYLSPAVTECRPGTVAPGNSLVCEPCNADCATCSLAKNNCTSCQDANKFVAFGNCRARLLSGRNKGRRWLGEEA